MKGPLVKTAFQRENQFFEVPLEFPEVPSAKISFAKDFKVKRAIISDIHGNLEALTAVMEDIEKQNVDEIFCLGDVIGYGPNPLECIDLVMEKCKVCLLGNHESGALFDPDGFNPTASNAIFWTRKQLEFPDEKRDDRWEFLNMLPRKHEEKEWLALFVHGSPKNPLNDYIFIDEIYSPKRMETLFNLVPHISFQGHTHVPGVFISDLRLWQPSENDFTLELLPDFKYLINVGSVGQPRDSNPKASYATVEDGAQAGHFTLTYRRIEYPINQTVEKITQIAELENCLAERLKKGH